jgi:O-antigen/teichoic acid export membrane protein
MMVRNIMGLFGTRLLVSLSGLVLFVAVARVLGPELQGVVSFSVMLVGMLVMIASLGLDSSAVFFLNRKKVTAKSYNNSILPLLLISTFILMVLVILAWSLGWMGPSGRPDELIPAILVAIIIMPLDVFLQVVRNLILAHERFDDFNGMERRLSILLVIFVGLSLYWKPDSASLVLVAYVMDRLSVIGWILKRLHHKPLEVREGGGAAPDRMEIFRYSVFPWMGNVLTLLSNRLDMLILAWFIPRTPQLSAADLGLYTVCMMAIARVQDAQAAIQSVFNPRVAALPLEEARVLAARFYRFSWLVYFGIFLLLVVGGWPVLAVFGPDYVQAYPILVLLAFGSLVVRANAGVLALFFTFSGRPNIPFRANLAATITSFILLLLLVPRFGALGAAASTTGSCIVLKGMLIVEFRRDGASYRRLMLLRRSDFQDFNRLLRQHLTSVLRPKSTHPMPGGSA